MHATAPHRPQGRCRHPARHARGGAAARGAVQEARRSAPPSISPWGPIIRARAMRRVFRKGFAQKVARTSVLKHYGLKTLMYGVLLPGPDIGRAGGGGDAPGARCGIRGGSSYLRSRALAGRRGAAPMRRGRGPNSSAASRRSSACSASPPASHAAAGWQINAHGLELEREFGFEYASDTAGRRRVPARGSASGAEHLPADSDDAADLRRAPGAGRHRRIEHRRRGVSACPRDAARDPPASAPQVFTLHAELEGMLLRDCLRVAAGEVARGRCLDRRHGFDARAGARSGRCPSGAWSWARSPGARARSPSGRRARPGARSGRRGRGAATPDDASRRRSISSACRGWSPCSGSRCCRCGRCSIRTRAATRRFRARCSRAATGSIPHLNGLAYIEKPPLQYWATAVDSSCSGDNEFAARLYTALSAFGLDARRRARGAAPVGARRRHPGGGDARGNAAVRDPGAAADPRHEPDACT